VDAAGIADDAGILADKRDSRLTTGVRSAHEIGKHLQVPGIALRLDLVEDLDILVMHGYHLLSNYTIVLGTVVFSA